MADIDPYTYLLGSAHIQMVKQMRVERKILSGATQKSIHSRRGVIGLQDVSRTLAQIHISLLADFLDQIRFPVFMQKNWRHPRSLEMSGDFAAKCLILPCTPSGRKYQSSAKIWVVTLVCKGTSLVHLPRNMVAPLLEDIADLG